MRGTAKYWCLRSVNLPKVTKARALLFRSAIQLELEHWAASLSMRGCSTYFVEQFPISLLHCIPACDLPSSRMSPSGTIAWNAGKFGFTSLSFFSAFFLFLLLPHTRPCSNSNRRTRLQNKTSLSMYLEGFFIYNNKLNMFYFFLFLPVWCRKGKVVGTMASWGGCCTWVLSLY